MCDLELEPLPPKKRKTTKTKRMPAAVASMPPGPSSRGPPMGWKRLDQTNIPLPSIRRRKQQSAKRSFSDEPELARGSNGAVFKKQFRQFDDDMLSKYEHSAFYFCNGCDGVLTNPKDYTAPKRSKKTSAHLVNVKPQLESVLRRSIDVLIAGHEESHAAQGQGIRPLHLTPKSEPPGFGLYWDHIENSEEFRRCEIRVILTLGFDGIRFCKLTSFLIKNEAVASLEADARRNGDESFVRLHKLISEGSFDCRFLPVVNLIHGWHVPCQSSVDWASLHMVHDVEIQPVLRSFELSSRLCHDSAVYLSKYYWVRQKDTTQHCVW
ncbi:unnamed protein product [Heligmosomoides polygyrus]|uniref:DUF659 domain-containing protein n=1 Tax=Heligmosomoides polygyrus TaxID=6339 RepID=A0A183GBR0_HELPZ|nr:unnamed protein product [Heligmosomoides polygyrus]